MKFFLVLYFSYFSLYAEQSPADSLRSLISHDKEDTSKVKHLNALAWELSSVKPDSSMLLSNEALRLAEKINYIPGVGNSYHQLASFYDDKGDFALSLQYYEKALAIWDSLLAVPKLKAATIIRKLSTIGNMGIVYEDQGDYAKSLNYFFSALQIAEEVKDKNRIAIITGNIGTVYRIQGEYSKALDYYLKALKIADELGDKNKTAIYYGDIGTVYLSQKEYARSLYYLSKALAMDSAAGNLDGVGRHLGNIGVCYDEQKEYSKALDYYFRSLKLKEELGQKNEVASTLGNIGSLYASTKQYAEAEKYLLQALAMDTAMGSLEGIMDVEKNLSELFERTGKPAPALSHYKKFMIAKDSLFNEEKNKEITRRELTYEFDKKEAEQAADRQRQEAAAEAEKKKQKIVLWSVVCCLLLVVGFAFFIFRSLGTTRKQKKIIEEKNKDITDSINYAKRIQEAILPPKEIKYKIFPEAFVLFLPKDIVSGDFYWFAEKNGRRIIAAIDCTGHGVPGGFMSMIGNTFLNTIVNEKEITQPDKILNELREMVIESLKQTEETGKDGMDIALLSFDDKNSLVEFAGANNPVVHISAGKTSMIKSDKQPIGYYNQNHKPFSLHKINYKKGDSFYIFSDGYADQFGGDKGKKFKEKKLFELFASIQTIPMRSQEETLLKTFNDWKGNLEQVDDVLVIGVKV